MVVDLEGVSSMTRAGARGILVAAKMLQCRGGEMRICGANEGVRRGLLNTGFRHLLAVDGRVVAA